MPQLPLSKTRAARLAALQVRETERFRATHPRSLALAAEAAPHWLFGLPMHWMRDWPTPSPLYVASARRARVRCADGLEYVDFCLGDTGAMFGHSPPPVAEAIAQQSAEGLTAMLPGVEAPDVGAALAAVFGLPRWQLTLSASDANRFVLRWARAITGRTKVLVFEGCYHGTVDDTLVDRSPDGRTLTRASLLGQLQDLALGTVVVPFNDGAAVRAVLAGGEVMTLEAYARMEGVAAGLAAGLEQLIAQAALPWSVARLGARMELQFCPQPPRNAQEAQAAMHEPVERALHLYLLNRGLLVTPFHNMVLVSPVTSARDADGLVRVVAGFLDELGA